MNIKRLVFVCLSTGLGLGIQAQTSLPELRVHPELATGNYCNYPTPTGHVTPAPDGYEPFYVSHYGRHGARYLTENNSYRYVIGKMDTARVMGCDMSDA